MRITKKTLIIGGGIAGLVSALLFKKRFPDTEVVIIEAEEKLGGLLKSFHYSDYGNFDYGTHYMMETGVQEIDDLFKQALPIEKRHVMEGFATDLSGIYYRGKLQRHTPFPDVRNHPNYSVYLSSLFKHLDNPTSLKTKDQENALEFFYARFGKVISEEVILPIVKKVFGYHLSDMTVMGMKFIPLTRIGMFDVDLMKDLVDTKYLSGVLAFTEQRLLPGHKQPKHKAFYPKTTGIGQLIEGFEKLLSDSNIKIKLNTRITHLDFEDNQIKAVKLKDIDSDTDQAVDVDMVINASGIFALARLLKLDQNYIRKMDPPFTTALVHLTFTKPLNTGGLYYFYCYDPDFYTFRVTDYHNFTDDTSSNRGYPITLEMVFQNAPPSKDDIVNIALAELYRMNLVDINTKPIFKEAEILKYGFPLLTTKNAQALDNLRKDIHALQLDNIIQCGALSEPEVYFQKDILIDTHRKISEIIDEL